MNSPLISVVIPTWNAAKYLPCALESVFAQTWPRVEIIVVDDGSTDETENVLEPFRQNIKYIRQENWGGPSRPRNVAVNAATGDYVAFFDSDDLMEPGKLASAASVLRDYPQVDFTFTNFREIDETGRVVTPDFLSDYRNFRQDLDFHAGPLLGFFPGRTAYFHLLAANFVGTSSVVCRRSVFDTVGLFDESMLNSDDVDMWRRIAYSGSHFAFIDEVLHSYRNRSDGVTARGTVRRIPHVLHGLRKQLDLDLTPVEEASMQRRINKVLLEFGHGLCCEGNYDQARRVFSEALSQRLSWRGGKGLAKAILRRGGQR